MKQQIIILSANPYSIKDEASGRTNEGVSINYLTNAEMEPVFNDNGSFGVRPAKGTLNRDQLANIGCAPGLYDADLEMAIGSDGRPTIRVKNITFLGALKVTVSKSEVTR